MTAAANSTLGHLSPGVVAGLETSFAIHAKDRFACARTTGGDMFQVVMSRTSGTPLAGPDTVAMKFMPHDNGDGTYTVMFTAPAAGDYQIDVGYDE
eukprot:3868318-Pyramimonas_sp.AAC.1